MARRRRAADVGLVVLVGILICGGAATHNANAALVLAGIVAGTSLSGSV